MFRRLMELAPASIDDFAFDRKAMSKFLETLQEPEPDQPVSTQVEPDHEEAADDDAA